jgi:hypothetical protein
MRRNTTVKSSHDSRDEKLWSLLPAKDAPYDYHSLSKAETDALIEALGDGFGDLGVRGSSPLPLPSKVQSGLLEHFFYDPGQPAYEEWGDEFLDDAFFSSANDDDAPAPYEVFPLGFNQRRLRIYFQNQFERFCEQLSRESPALASLDRLQDRSLFREKACQQLYEKPWYEFHALQFFDFIEQSIEALSKRPAFEAMCISLFAGQLGRLVEQYCWRCQFEKAATAGAGARKGASAGGRSKAERDQDRHSTWQNEASKIWARRPELTKHAVGQRIQKKFGETCTAKHIARYINRR